MNTRPGAAVLTLITIAVACKVPTEPPIRVDVTGTWNLTSMNHTLIPGWVTACDGFGCDSSYVVSGQLVFGSSLQCTRTVTHAIGGPAVQECRYLVHEGEVTVEIGGVSTYTGSLGDPDPGTHARRLILSTPQCCLQGDWVEAYVEAE